MKQQKTSRGYHIVYLYGRNKYITKTVHSLMLEAFVCPRPNGMEACHNDGNKDNNFLFNLRWDTPKNNSMDRLIHGTQARGSKCGASKLSEEDVYFIRKNESTLTARELSKKFGVSNSNIIQILKGKIWTHIQGE